MADITSTIQAINGSSNKVLFWETLTSANVRGVARKVSHFANITVFILGTIGGATVVVEGAANDDGTNTVPADDQFITLYDSQQNAMSFTAVPSNPRTVLTIPNWLRPKTSGGDGTQDIDVLTVCTLARR